MMKPYRGGSQPPALRQTKGQNQLAQRNNLEGRDPFQMEMFQEFDNFSNQIMKRMDDRLGGLGFGSLMNFGGFDDIDRQLMEFSNVHNHMRNLDMRDVRENANNGGVFQMYSKSYVQSSKMDGNGKMVTEKYFDNNAVARGVGGNTISERQQGYKNSGQGVDKFAHERMINDQGKKYIKERDRGGNINLTNHYYNMDENQLQYFDNKWGQYQQQIGFDPKKIGYDQKKNSHQYQQPVLSSNVDMNALPYQAAQDNLRRRATDIQPIMLGGGAIQQQPMRQMQAIAPTQQQYGPQTPQRYIQPQNMRMNEDHAGVYRNKNVGRNQYPQAG